MILNSLLKKKEVHFYIFIVSISIALIIVGILMFRYHIEGERNLPFNLKKIGLISTAEAIYNKSNNEELTAELMAKNNIYFYIEKNSNYHKEEIIKKVLFSNFNITSKNDKGIVKIYRPSANDNNYDYDNDCEIQQTLEYSGGTSTDTEILQINNQGGIIGFSVAIRDLASYIPNENESLPSNGLLLNKANVSLEDITFSISFDIIIETEEGHKFKANIILNLPVDNILEKGVSSMEINSLKDIVFKRF